MVKVIGLILIKASNKYHNDPLKDATSALVHPVHLPIYSTAKKKSVFKWAVSEFVVCQKLVDTLKCL